MAYDGYGNSTDQQPQYEYPDPRMAIPSPYHPSDAYESRSSRHSSRERGNGEPVRPYQPRQPINEAVSTAFNNADPTNNNLHPELIAQITENVIKQLQRSGIEAGTPIQPTHQRYHPPPTYQPTPQSPSTAFNTAPPMTRNVYTPPSPHKHTDFEYGSPESQPYQPVRPPSPREPSISQFAEKRPPSRVSQTSEVSTARPQAQKAIRMPSSQEETTLEKIWGCLFDDEGHPTVRLGQFLRGLAVHLIEDYEPRNSLVITPRKMIKYYEDTKLPNETYPWSHLFDDEKCSISRMFRELECQHHLVQERFDERPDIPALTPEGFERWTTYFIQAHPEEEYRRLQKAVLEMPISNPDDRKERFPKEISRRLFPKTDDRRVRERIEKAILEHSEVKLMKSQNADLPPPPKPPPPFSEPLRRTETIETEPPYLPSTLERERKPYSNIPSECAIDDTNPPGTNPQPIERERKPYRVQPGGGKMYDEDGRVKQPPSHLGRSNSNADRTRPVSMNPPYPLKTTDLPVSEAGIYPRGSMPGRRRHSPPINAGTNDFRRSDGDLRIPASVYQPQAGPTTEVYEDDSRRSSRVEADRRGEYARRQADDDIDKFGGSPSSRTRYDPRADPRYESGSDGGRRGQYSSDEDYYRVAGSGIGRGTGSGYEYPQGYSGPTYR
ncbi:MAG: hypothetical protein MMC33_008338 [Icmadophila ericetorum]|nr:hypothetical protein [Icmadophila ericetorum]